MWFWANLGISAYGWQHAVKQLFQFLCHRFPLKRLLINITDNKSAIYIVKNHEKHFQHFFLVWNTSIFHNKLIWTPEDQSESQRGLLRILSKLRHTIRTFEKGNYILFSWYLPACPKSEWFFTPGFREGYLKNSSLTYILDNFWGLKHWMATIILHSISLFRRNLACLKFLEFLAATPAMVNIIKWLSTFTSNSAISLHSTCFWNIVKTRETCILSMSKPGRFVFG